MALRLEVPETPARGDGALRQHHSADGRIALYVSPGCTIGIDGIPDDEAIPILKELYAHQARPEFIYYREPQAPAVVVDPVTFLLASNGKIMKSILLGAITLSLVMLQAAFAANPWEPGGTLETCLEAVLKERPGVVTGWQQSGGGEATPYVVSVLNPEGTNAETFCDPARPTNFQFKNKSGLFRYSMYERATFADAKARASAPDIFTGPVRVTSMELSVGISGRPVYKYQMFLPSNHKASVEIDAVTGRLNKAVVN